MRYDDILSAFEYTFDSQRGYVTELANPSPQPVGKIVQGVWYIRHKGEDVRVLNFIWFALHGTWPWDHAKPLDRNVENCHPSNILVGTGPEVNRYRAVVRKAAALGRQPDRQRLRDSGAVSAAEGVIW